jgi:glucan phosphorylase
MKYADDDKLLSEFQQIKTDNKLALAKLIGTLLFLSSQNPRESYQHTLIRMGDGSESELGVKVDPTAQFTVQIKRIHEYKRQQLNLFGIISQYLEIKQMSPEEKKEVVPRVCVFAGKAAPGALPHRVGLSPSPRSRS